MTDSYKVGYSVDVLDDLHEIYSYIADELSTTVHTVSGMLLYAKTDEEIYPDNVYQMSGN